MPIAVQALFKRHFHYPPTHVVRAPGRLELVTYHTPKASTPKPEITPANTLGLHRVMFAVDDIEDTIARLRTHGAELIGEVVRYEDKYLLCYVRGPEGIIVALAEQLS